MGHPMQTVGHHLCIQISDSSDASEQGILAGKGRAIFYKLTLAMKHTACVVTFVLQTSSDSYFA